MKKWNSPEFVAVNVEETANGYYNYDEEYVPSCIPGWVWNTNDKCAQKDPGETPKDPENGNS